MQYSRFLQLKPIYYFCEIDYVFKTEQWIPIINYEGLYEISDLGRVKSLSKVQLNHGKYPWITKEKILRPGNTSKNQLIVGLYKDSKTKSRTIHQLVDTFQLLHKILFLFLLVDYSFRMW